MERIEKHKVKFQNFSRRSSKEKKINFSFNADTYQPENFTHPKQNSSKAKMRARQTPNAQKIKFEIKKIFFDNRWRQLGLQLPLPFYEGDGGLIQKMWEQKKHFLMCNLHELFTQDVRSYLDVYRAFNEFLLEHGLCAEFKEYMTSPLEFWMRCALEYSHRQDYATKLTSTI